MKKTVLILSFILSVNLFSQESKLKKPLLERMLDPKISLDSSYLSDAKVDSSDGSVKVAKNSIKLNNALGGISYTNWSFLWSDIASLPFGNGVDEPIEQMHSLKLNFNLPYSINENWFLLTSLMVRSTFEKEMQDSYGGGIYSFASYKLSDEHTFQIGAFANYHPISTLVLPIVSYSYRARKTDGLQVVLGFPRAYVGYYINDLLLLRSGMIFSQSVIKLSDENVVESSGYIEAQDYVANFGFVYEFTPSFTLDSDVLYSLSRDFIIYDSSGSKQSEYKIKPSVGISFRLKYLF